MAKISTYPQPTAPALNDYLIGTDQSDADNTKNFEIADILALTNIVINLTTGNFFAGFAAGYPYVNSNVTAIGGEAAKGNSADDVNAFGYQAGLNNAYANVNLFGNTATADEAGQTVLSKDGVIMARLSTLLLSATRKYTLANMSGVLSPINIADNFANDAAAAAGGIPINGLYHTAGTVKIRLI